MSANRVYFIGAGPGEADLLSLRGARRLAACGLVFAPEPFDATFSDLLVGKQVEVPFDYRFEVLLERIGSALEVGEVAFLVPGDLTFFSPFQALVDAFGERAEVIPGVGIANAASAALKKTLDLPGVCSHTVLASPRILGHADAAPTLGDLAAPGASLLVYMNDLPLAELVRQLRAGFGRDVPIALLHRLGLPGQEIVTGRLSDIEERVGARDFFHLDDPSRGPALTLVVAGETLCAEVDGAWWNYRYENIWRHRRGG